MTETEIYFTFYSVHHMELHIERFSFIFHTII